MKTMPIVIDISSEEEQEDNEIDIDSDWIRKILGMSDEVLNEVDDVLGEDKKPKNVVVVVDDDAGNDDDDDDCVVLEDDPENNVKCVNDSPTGSDELLVVGQKGQVACRDYPHPRHLCANFPYSSTPHEKHCDQCHCYVCDSPAPCLNWGNGLSDTDHCHATDKSETWKSLRKVSKEGKTAPSPTAATNYATLGDVVNFHILPPDITRSSSNFVSTNRTPISTASYPFLGNAMHIPHNQALQSITTMNACSTHIPRLPTLASRSTASHPFSVNVIPQNQASLPTTMNAQLRERSSRLQNEISMRNNVTERSTASTFTIPNGANNGSRTGYILGRDARMSILNRDIQKKQRQKVSGLGHQHMMLKGTDSVGAGNTATTNYVTAPGASSYGSWERYNAAATVSNIRNSYGRDYVPINRTIDSLPSQRNYSSAYETQPYYQSNNIQNPYGYNNVYGNDALSSCATFPNRNQHVNEQQIGRQNENGGGNIDNWGATKQDVFQQKGHGGSQNEYERMTGFVTRDSSWGENNNGQNISYVQNMVSNIPPNANESNTPSTASTQLSMNDIEHWMLGFD